MTEECYVTMEPKAMYAYIDKFVKDNQGHRCIENRWMAAQVARLTMSIHDLAVNGIGSFSAKYAKELAEFRLAEIEKEQSKLNREIEKLAEEATRMKRQTAA